MLLAIFVGLESSLMNILGKYHHLGIFFLASPNNVSFISKLYRIVKKRVLYKILSDSKLSRGTLGLVQKSLAEAQ